MTPDDKNAEIAARIAEFHERLQEASNMAMTDQINFEEVLRILEADGEIRKAEIPAELTEAVVQARAAYEEDLQNLYRARYEHIEYNYGSTAANEAFGYCDYSDYENDEPWRRATGV